MLSTYPGFCQHRHENSLLLTINIIKITIDHDPYCISLSTLSEIYTRVIVYHYQHHQERESCLLVLNSVTSTPQWIQKHTHGWCTELHELSLYFFNFLNFFMYRSMRGPDWQ